MARFVRIDALERKFQGPCLFAGEIQGRFDATVADQFLVDLHSGALTASISGYPVWCESGLTLVVRLLAQAELDAVPLPALQKGVAVSYRIGRSIDQSIELEYLQASVEGTRLNVTLLSPLGVAARLQAPHYKGTSVADAIRMSVGAALGWGCCLPPLPRPLSEVPVRNSPGKPPYVRLTDIPAFPRQEMRRHFHLDSDVTQVSAEQWLRFVHWLQKVSSRLHAAK